ncbi:hypothetical protein ACIBCT_38470 [Streptosporangium sp. NPDC050855]
MEPGSDSIRNVGRDTLNRIGRRRAGGTTDRLDWRTQASGPDGLIPG